MTDRVVVTGALGNLGQRVLHELARRGRPALALDRPAALSGAAAFTRDLPAGIELRPLDLATAGERELEGAVEGAAGVLHLAAVLPPASDRDPAAARTVNVTRTLALIAALERGPGAPFVFPSSLTVFGPPADRGHLHGPDDPTRATDPYSAHKLEVEAALARSRLPWVVLRVGVSVDARTLSTDLGTLRRLLSTHPDHPLHWVHPDDVAFALCESLVTPAAHRRVLCVGGDASCRVTMRAFLSAAPAAVGLGVPRLLFGRGVYPTSWLDTSEAQRLLGFQRRGFAVYQAELRAAVRGRLRLGG